MLASSKSRRVAICPPFPTRNNLCRFCFLSGIFIDIFSVLLMPSAAKRLLSKTPLPIDKALVQELMISKEDIRLMKHYNMFVMV